MTPISRSIPLRGLAAALALSLSAAAQAAGAASAPPSAPASAATLPAASALPYPTLPSQASIDRLLEQAPTLLEANAQRQAAGHSAQVLRLGSNEFNAQAQVQRRRIDAPPDSGSFTEWQLQVNRQMRLPSQARADNGMADATTASAQTAVATTRQSLMSEVLSVWFGAQRTQAEALLAADDLALLERQLAALQRRNAVGDASVLEVELMQAEIGRARSALALARGTAISRLAALTARYPALVGDVAATGSEGSVAAPALPDAPADALLAEMERSSAGVAHGRAMLKQAQAAAAQAKAARTPQPTVGLYVGSERGGSERIVGLQFAIPFGGPARTERERAAVAEAEAARWKLQDMQVQARADFEALLATARSQAAAADAADSAVRTQSQASARLMRAYQLGEAGLSDWLLARRSTLDTLRQAIQSRFDAAQSAAQVRLWTGQLYAPPTDAGGAG